MRRKKIKKSLKYSKNRVVLSDTLPYETPLTFSNRYFYNFSFAASRIVAVAPVGFMMGSSVSNTRRDLYLNGTSVANNTTTDTITFLNYNLFLGAANINNSSVASYTNSQCAFASIGNGLTDTDASNLYTRVQAFQTALSRQV